tara:strand:+ start:947 stop:1324 length:378 start_codon:yes stop_codon:yes gene_type:complete
MVDLAQLCRSWVLHFASVSNPRTPILVRPLVPTLVPTLVQARVPTHAECLADARDSRATHTAALASEADNDARRVCRHRIGDGSCGAWPPAVAAAHGGWGGDSNRSEDEQQKAWKDDALRERHLG